MGRPGLKVMHIITRMVRGGAQLVLLELLRGQVESRYEVILATGEQTGSEGSLWGELGSVPVQIVPVPQLVREISPWRDFRALRSLRRIITEVRPDIVHSHTSKAGLLGSMAARQVGVPGVVLSPHGHILGTGAEIPGVPSAGWKRRLLAAAARRGTSYADVVIAPNDSEREDGIRHRMWSAAEAVTVPNGVDTRRFAPRDRNAVRRRLGWSPEECIIGTAARLTREKGVDVAIAALTHLEAVRLVIAGNGPELLRLEAQAAQLRVEDRVTFLGVWDAIEDLLPALDVVVVPSRTEAHGMVAAEALACECPVVCSDVGGLRSLVVHERTGLTVPPDDPERLASGVRRLLAKPTVASKLARAGRARVDRSFSLGGMVARTAELYETIVGDTRS